LQAVEAITRSPLLLDVEEVQQITGFKLRRKQIDWLRTKHWQFEVNARGVPIIARSYAESRLSGISASPQAVRVRRPNFEAVRAA
jgi:hypothetical protein